MNAARKSTPVGTLRTDASTARARVVIVDRHDGWRRAVRTALSMQAIDGVAIPDGESALADVSIRGADLIAIRHPLNGLSGADMVRRLRAARITTGALLIADMHRRVPSRAQGDGTNVTYMATTASVATVCDAISAGLTAMPARDLGEIFCGGVRLNLNTGDASLPGGYRVHLTAREAEIVEVFLRHPGCVLTRDFIHRAVWGGCHSAPSIVDVHIGRLRGKLGLRRFITHRGRGYELLPLPLAAPVTERR